MKILFVYSNKTCGCTKKYTFELARGMKKYVNTKVIYYTELTSDIVKEFDVIILQRLGTITIIDKDEVNNIIDIIIFSYFFFSIFSFLIYFSFSF